MSEKGKIYQRRGAVAASALGLAVLCSCSADTNKGEPRDSAVPYSLNTQESTMRFHPGLVVTSFKSSYKHDVAVSYGDDFIGAMVKKPNHAVNVGAKMSNGNVLEYIGIRCMSDGTVTGSSIFMQPNYVKGNVEFFEAQTELRPNYVAAQNLCQNGIIYAAKAGNLFARIYNGDNNTGGTAEDRVSLTVQPDPDITDFIQVNGL
jgi:hypothetical protein